jgi:hypothetical protein
VAVPQGDPPDALLLQEPTPPLALPVLPADPELLVLPVPPVLVLPAPAELLPVPASKPFGVVNPPQPFENAATTEAARDAVNAATTAGGARIEER